ncbi:uncharacterized protein LOC144632479 isoform X1 [Oculina patagonica]
MPPKKSNSKNSFRVFSNDNYSKFANRFPFLKERQIKAKLLQTWRNKFTSQTTKGKAEIKKAKHRNKTLLNGAECGTPVVSQKDAFENRYKSSPLSTYSNRRHNNKVRDGFAKEKRCQTARIANCSSPCSSESTACGSGSSSLGNNKVVKKQRATHGRKENELIDLFQEISAEQLLIEPGEINVADNEVMTSTPVCFNHKEWLERLAEDVEDEKNTNTVCGMFKWRADRKRKTSQKNEEESSYESRCLVSNDREGCSNFFSMFDEEEDIFL